MSLLPARVPTTALYDYTALFVPSDVPTGSTVELKITLVERDLSVRDFGAYLSLSDRIYGRLTEAGLRSYSRTPYQQLRISEIRKGSVEVLITEAIAHSREAIPITILFLFLRHFNPKSLTESAKNLAEAYKSVEEAKTIRETRKQQREVFRRDETLAKLNPDRINQLVILLEDLQEKEGRLLPAANRFAEESVESVELVVLKKLE